jgi:hypothetical protein
VEEQRLIIEYEVLVERKPACTLDHNGRINAIDPVSNLKYIRPGLAVRNGHPNLLVTSIIPAAFKYVSANQVPGTLF